ncbi:MAG: copper homeostasis protein CutC [Clostridiales bacterium]|nr:copper homeostasis protein CutC [Clostridiales bacterium]
MILEACVGSYEEAKIKEKFGANRIELCDNLKEGGTTPSYGVIKKSVEDIKIPINVIIRPRGGNFIYSKEEKEIMLLDIELCNKLNVNGIVVGALNEESKIDIEFIKRVKKVNKTKEITFHMAFDEIEDKKKAIDTLVELNINRILTKGGVLSAPNNLQSIKELINYAGNRIIIMPGGGITKDNKDYIIRETGALELHGTKIV